MNLKFKKIVYSIEESSGFKNGSFALFREKSLELKIPIHELDYSLGENFKIFKKPLLSSTRSLNKFSFIDLFAGIGGFHWAGKLNGGNCVFSSEFDQFAQKTYAHNFGELPSGDITKIEESTIPSHDILFAGFPCQPFSYSGQNLGFEDKTRGTLFFDILRVLKYHKPAAFLLENVKGLKSHNKGETLKIIEKSLAELGYTISWKILSSYDFGLPQLRERWYCVGFLNDEIFEFPEGYKKGAKLRDIVEMDNYTENLSIKPHEIERIKHHWKYATLENPRVEHDSSKYEPHTKKGRHGVFSFQKNDGSLRFHIGDHAKTQIQEAFYTCLDTYSPTIIANRTPKLWDLERKLSVKECLRLQGFPEDFKFPVSDAQAYKQLGNSVSIPVIDSIIKEIIKYIK